MLLDTSAILQYVQETVKTQSYIVKARVFPCSRDGGMLQSHIVSQFCRYSSCQEVVEPV